MLSLRVDVARWRSCPRLSGDRHLTVRFELRQETESLNCAGRILAGGGGLIDRTRDRRSYPSPFVSFNRRACRNYLHGLTHANGKRCEVLASHEKTTTHEEPKGGLDVKILWRSDSTSAGGQLHVEQQKIRGNSGCRQQSCRCGCDAGFGVLHLGTLRGLQLWLGLREHRLLRLSSL
jgi:hypothetical protein